VILSQRALIMKKYLAFSLFFLAVTSNIQASIILEIVNDHESDIIVIIDNKFATSRIPHSQVHRIEVSPSQKIEVGHVCTEKTFYALPLTSGMEEGIISFVVGELVKYGYGHPQDGHTAIKIGSRQL
jgi:hypothetical protein